MQIRNSYNRKVLFRGAVVLILLGVLSYGIETFGEGHLTGLVNWIEARGNYAPMIFMLINVLGMILVLPQTMFTVVAGVLFGAVKGTLMCLISLALGSAFSFLLGRFIFRERILKKFGTDPNFRRLEMLSRRHPVKVLALSRIVPVVPYSVANYLWSVTRVKFIPYLVMSVLCLIPETVFLTAGGHILSAGVTRGTFNWELFAVLGVAAAVIFFLVRAVRKSLGSM